MSELHHVGELPAVSSWVMRLWGQATQATFLGERHLPLRGPAMLVGNHTLMGLYDTPVLLFEVFRRRGYVLRAMGDHVHFRVPGWSWLLRQHGAVPGTRDHCRALLRGGEVVLVFPGGGREVSKRRGEKYRLFWGERRGFARLAVETGAAIVPFCAVGAEEAWDVVLGADELMASPLGHVVRALGVRPSVLLPIVRGLGPTPVPRLVRLAFEFFEPLEPDRFAEHPDDEQGVLALRDQVRAIIEAGLARLRR